MITEANNASKGAAPLRTDLQVLSLLRKRSAASKAAAQVFAQAKREDLKGKQEAEIAVLEEYAAQVHTMPAQEVGDAIDQALHELGKRGSGLNPGLVMRELFKAGGRLKDKPVETTSLVAMIKSRISRKKSSAPSK